MKNRYYQFENKLRIATIQVLLYLIKIIWHNDFNGGRLRETFNDFEKRIDEYKTVLKFYPKV